MRTLRADERLDPQLPAPADPLGHPGRHPRGVPQIGLRGRAGPRARHQGDDRYRPLAFVVIPANRAFARGRSCSWLKGILNRVSWSVIFGSAAPMAIGRGEEPKEFRFNNSVGCYG